MDISLIEYTKVLQSLENAFTEPKSDIVRDSTTHRFKLSVDLAWKSAMKLMGTTTSAPKQVVREMAQNKLIEDIEFSPISRAIT